MKQLANISTFESIMNLRPIKHNGLVIRRIKPKEIAQQYDLDNKCFDAGYTPTKQELSERKRSLRTSPNEIIVGAFDGKKMVGYSSFTVADTGIGCDAEWDHAAVDKNYWGRGLQRATGMYGERLLPKHVQTIGTTILPDNKYSRNNAVDLGYKIRDGVTYDDTTGRKLDLLTKERTWTR